AYGAARTVRGAGGRGGGHARRGCPDVSSRVATAHGEEPRAQIQHVRHEHDDSDAEGRQEKWGVVIKPEHWPDLQSLRVGLRPTRFPSGLARGTRTAP